MPLAGGESHPALQKANCNGTDARRQQMLVQRLINTGRVLG